jgi:hypothetical protein
LRGEIPLKFHKMTFTTKWDIGNTVMVTIRGKLQPKKIIGIQFKYGFACYKLEDEKGWYHNLDLKNII